MRKDWVSLTEEDLRKMRPQVQHVEWKYEGEFGPLFIYLTNGTRIAYQQSRFNPNDAKWFSLAEAKKLANKLEVKLIKL